VPILRQDGGFVGVLQASDKYQGDLNEFMHVARLIAPTFELEYINHKLQQRAEYLEKRTAELDRENEAMEHSNVASHDLHTPASPSSFTTIITGSLMTTRTTISSGLSMAVSGCTC